MKISFLGAAKTVTGSCYLVETKSTKLLVDCGLYQGHSKENALNAETFPFNPSELDFVLLTHCHIDHSGRIPKVILDGFKGEVITTCATKDLCGIMLPDCGHIQEIETEWLNRKRERAGKHLVEPLYTFQNALDSLKYIRGVRYGEEIKLSDEVRVRFNDAGHILGSAIIELWANEDGQETKVVFSGDLGNKNTPILRDPSIIDSADYLVIESTYGNRLHNDNTNKVDRFVNIINETAELGGNIIIPSFAVGRTQEIIYDLHKEKGRNEAKIKKLFSLPVFIDSPLATSATEIFRKNLDCYDEEARAYIENGDNPIDFPGLEFTKSVEDSKRLNERDDSIIIVSASGMCEAGRIKHHLKHNLWKKENTILFVGYQAVGTLGRKLVDGAKRVKLFGEDIHVNARIEMIEGFSGHADRDGLLEWIGQYKKKPSKIFIVHGEETGMTEFASSIKNSFGIESIIPSKGESFFLKPQTVAKSEERIYVPYKFKRLAVVEIMETLKEELEEMTEILKQDLKAEKEDFEIDEIRAKLKTLEKTIVEVLK
ncbi:MAG TPA: MBL fold metallo-hydrolase [Clostridia bacterium]